MAEVEQFACLVCGKPSAGAWSEGGLQWAICPACIETQLEHARAERAHYVLRDALTDPINASHKE